MIWKDALVDVKRSVCILDGLLSQLPEEESHHSMVQLREFLASSEDGEVAAFKYLHVVRPRGTN